jgi:Protein of unknown function (DUF1329)
LALNNEIENQFASAVKRAIEVSRTKAATACPAPDIVAAYHKHVLGDAEHLRWQAHLAGCTRCQTLLAEISCKPSSAVVSSPDAVSDPPRLRRPGASRMRWIVAPIAAIAVIVVEMSPPTVTHRAAEISALPPGHSASSASRAQIQGYTAIPPDKLRGEISGAPNYSRLVSGVPALSSNASPKVLTAPRSATLAPNVTERELSVAALIAPRLPSEKSPAGPPSMESHQSYPTRHREVAPGAIEAAVAGTKQVTLAAPSMQAQMPPRRVRTRANLPLMHESSVTPSAMENAEQYSQRTNAMQPAPRVVASAGRATALINNTAARPNVVSPVRMSGIYAPDPNRTALPTLHRPQDAGGALALGTKITLANWQQYRGFMPDGMIALFSGKYGLKMPNDVEIDVGPPNHIVAPGSFRQASEKYGGEPRVVHLPNGRNDIANYVAGEPFPVPQGPDKGYEILADLWYTYSPHLAVGMPGRGLWSVTMLDRFGNATKATWAFVYRQLAFNTDPEVPRTDPRLSDAFYTQWLMAEEPEQAKYTTDLDILPQDNQQNEQNYIFLPALRRSISFSVSARCAPLLGTDWTHDDQKPGFNGGLANFDADYLRNMKMLALVNLSEAVSDFPREYDMPLGFARPSWGSWSLRDVWVINIHRIPSEAAGYCYAKRIEYIDEETARSLWEDLYDSDRNLWKVTLSAYYPRKVPGTDGETIYGRFAASTWDLQNQHATLGNSTDPSGRLIMFNAEVPREFDDVTQYSSPSGLMQIMR